MKRFALLLSVFCLIFAAADASAQLASRTWVAGLGDDANPCTLQLPCKTWAGAFSRTAPGGEMDALDSGGFGPLTINKAITIDGGAGNVAGILGMGVTGFTITANPSTDRVLIRNMTINGNNSSFTGIRINSAKSVTIQNVGIYNFSANPGRGIDAQCTSPCRITIRDTKVDNNSGIGMVFQGAVPNSVFADVYNSSTSNNVSHGVFATNGAIVTLTSHVSSSNGITGLVIDGNGTNVTTFLSTFTNNLAAGVQAGTGPIVTAKLDLGKTVISGNNPGVQIAGAVVRSHNDNNILGNTVEVSGGSLAPFGEQ
jgi:hypothetical protein